MYENKLKYLILTMGLSFVIAKSKPKIFLSVEERELMN